MKPEDASQHEHRKMHIESSFYIGQTFGHWNEIDTINFAGRTLRDILPRLQCIFEIDHDADEFLVNDRRVSIDHYELDYGDEVRIIHASKASHVPSRKSDEGEQRRASEEVSLLIVNPDTFTVTYQVNSLFLGNTLSFKLMEHLANAKGLYIRNETLRTHVWKDSLVSDDAIRNAINRLRTKLHDAGMTSLVLDNSQPHTVCLREVQNEVDVR